jgi:NAD(P)-dependent dehydrogenase (short-subunit alcohol dehydrogenase family)
MLTGKVAMITGSDGGHGFGRAIAPGWRPTAIARRLAADGADLVLSDVVPAGVKVVPAKPTGGGGGLEAVAGEVRRAGRRAVTALVDVRPTDRIEAAVRAALEAFGRGRLCAAGRLRRLEVRAHRPHPGAGRGAGAGGHHGERDLSRGRRHRPAGLPGPPARRHRGSGAAGAGHPRARRPRPAGRLATVEDVAEVAAFLVLPGAGYMTGGHQRRRRRDDALRAGRLPQWAHEDAARCPSGEDRASEGVLEGRDGRSRRVRGAVLIAGAGAIPSPCLAVALAGPAGSAVHSGHGGEARASRGRPFKPGI